MEGFELPRSANILPPSMHRPLGRNLLQFLYSRKNPPPNSPAVQVALVQQFIHPHACVKGRIFAVLINQQFSRAVDVNIVDHARSFQSPPGPPVSSSARSSSASISPKIYIGVHLCTLWPATTYQWFRHGSSSPWCTSPIHLCALVRFTFVHLKDVFSHYFNRLWVGRNWA